MGLKTSRFTVEGMHCRSCSALVQMEVGELPGVASVQADHQSGIADVIYDDEVVAVDRIVQAIERAGYHAQLETAR